jgi:hypothetical protein
VVLHHWVLDADPHPLSLPLRYPGPRAVHDSIKVYTQHVTIGVPRSGKTKVGHLGKVEPMDSLLRFSANL